MRWNRLLRISSGTLVFLQFSLIFWLLYQGPVFAEGVIGIIVQLLGLLLGCWAIFVMGRRYIKISPLPVENGKIIRKGPYAVIRNPMYLSIMLWFIPIVVNDPDLKYLLKLLSLLIVLGIKILIEEKTLSKTNKNYDLYRSSTYRILPWLC